MIGQRLFISSILFILVLLSPFQYVYSSELDNQMKFHLIDVGQGDSMLIETPSNQTILIDGGPPKSEQKLMNYLNSQKIDKINLLIVTHPDIDHIGGLPQLMKSFEVNQIVDTGKKHTTKVYDDYIDQIIKQEIPVKLAEKNERIPIDPQLNIQILNSYQYFKSNNESSIALHVQYHDVDFLLMSDVETEQEKQIIKKYDLTADIVKIAHHGSSTSSSKEFLRSTEPKVALLSYSKTNDFGHPHEEVIERLKRMNTSIYSTAEHGNIVIHTDGKEYDIFTEKIPLDLPWSILQKTG